MNRYEGMHFGTDDTLASETVEAQAEKTDAEKELELLIESHQTKLLEIAKTFGIDISTFSEERDREIEEIQSVLLAVNQPISTQDWVSYKQTGRYAHQTITIKDDRRAVDESTGIAQIKSDVLHAGYESRISDIINTFGYVPGAYHENTIVEQFDNNKNGLMGRGRLDYTETEFDQIQYFNQENPDGYINIKVEAVSLAKMIEINRIRKQSPLVDKFLVYLESEGLLPAAKVSGFKFFYKEFAEASNLPISTVEELSSLIGHVDDNYGSFNPSVRELGSEMGRLMIELSWIGSKRRNYIPSIVDSDPSFSLIIDDQEKNEKIYSVAHDFTFPEDQTESAQASYDRRLEEMLSKRENNETR